MLGVTGPVGVHLSRDTGGTLSHCERGLSLSGHHDILRQDGLNPQGREEYSLKHHTMVAALRSEIIRGSLLPMLRENGSRSFEVT